MSKDQLRDLIAQMDEIRHRVRETPRMVPMDLNRRMERVEEMFAQVAMAVAALAKERLGDL